jgi:hypothetical protein
MRRLFSGWLLAGLCVAFPAQAADDFKLEPGFVLLFNGKNLDGFKTSGGEALEGKTDAFKGRFKVAGSHLTIDPEIKGNAVIFTNKEFPKDVHIKFQFNPGTGCNNDLYFRNNKFDIKKGLTGLKEGDWNELDIIVTGDKVEFKVNGATQKAAGFKSTNNALGIRAEFGPIQIRHLRYKEGS